MLILDSMKEKDVRKVRKRELVFKTDDDLLECFFSEKINKYCLLFNSKLYTYKTENGFVHKRDYFIDKYKLKPSF